jgi:uncharacterized zinc-type alcohol dehydrogenase-like protein
MLQTKGYAAHSPTDTLKPFEFERRDLGANDILIEIAFCGVCHSDIHQVRDEWGGSMYPMVPGHEIVGRVAQTGTGVSKFSEGDYAGVGCFVDSCRECGNCKEGVEQFCLKQAAMTYNGTEMDRKTPTFGGYSSQIVVDENYALKINDTENLAGVAPLLCAGITTYSPLKRLMFKRVRKSALWFGRFGSYGRQTRRVDGRGRYRFQHVAVKRAGRPQIGRP